MNAEEEGAIRLSIVGTEFLHVYFARSWPHLVRNWNLRLEALRFVLYACHCHIHSHSRNQRWDLHLPSKFITTRRSVLHRGLALDFSGWTNHRVEYPCGRRQKTTNQVVSCQKSFDLEVGNWQKSESFESFAWKKQFHFHTFMPEPQAHYLSALEAKPLLARFIGSFIPQSTTHLLFLQLQSLFGLCLNLASWRRRPLLQVKHRCCLRRLEDPVMLDEFLLHPGVAVIIFSLFVHLCIYFYGWPIHECTSTHFGQWWHSGTCQLLAGLILRIPHLRWSSRHTQPVRNTTSQGSSRSQALHGCSGYDEQLRSLLRVALRQNETGGNCHMELDDQQRALCWMWLDCGSETQLWLSKSFPSKRCRSCVKNL